MINCLVFGTGKTAQDYLNIFNYNKIRIVAFIDNDKFKQGKKWDNIIIDSPDNIDQYKFDYIFICSVKTDEIKKQLIDDLHINPVKIIGLLDLIERRNRTILFNRFLQYNEGFCSGIEVGGANAPLRVFDERIIIRQVDICSHENSNDGYDRLNVPLAHVDIIDNGERLDKIQNGSQDFIIACHFIEHCRNPIGTLKNFLKKLRCGGLVLLAIPDKRVTFDKNREITSFEHLLSDECEPSDKRDVFHIYDRPEEELTAEERVAAYDAFTGNTRPHFHVWDANAWNQFIMKCQEYLKFSFEVETTGNLDHGNGYNEILCVLKKVN